MLKISRLVIISILIVTQWQVWGQNNTNSPYTRFGFGELADRSFGAGRAMGGVGIGLRSPRQINPMNPASYSSMDSLTFLFDFGVVGQLSWFDDGVNKQKDINGNIEYMAMQFPVTKRLALSLGLLPYSFVGYDFGTVYSEGDAPYVQAFSGSGGLNEMYLGASIDIWQKRLAIGANAGYFFGNIVHEQQVQFSSSTGGNNLSFKEHLRVKDLKFDFGAQYTHPLSLTQRMVFGLTYSPANKLQTTSYKIETIGDPSGSTTNATSDTISGQRFDIPDSYGFGLSYIKDNKLTIAVDALYETWENAYFFDEKGDFKNRLRLAGGLEFIPNSADRAFFNRIRYRAGAHYSNSYLKVNTVIGEEKTGFGYNEYGASIGLGFPLIDMRSFVNVTFEYVKVKPESRLMIDEQYFRFTVNYTFNEMWFRKRKIE